MTESPRRELDYADLPIDTPSQDLFGVDDFVSSLARSVRKMKSPKGVVIALNGPWGSGKSSAINLLKHHLKDQAGVDDLQTVDFNPWWFRGEEALVLAFFRELYTATEPSLGEKARKLLPKLGARLLKAGSVVAPVADAAGASGVGTIASGVMTWLGDMIKDGESVEKLHAELATALAAQGKRFVVMIDDIDRLAPDEALAMFRLVKSVGRLPNVIYILAFDRLLAERMVAERFPSEGPHYLEKIVQASFELPPPVASDLHLLLITNLFEIAGAPEDRMIVHVMNLFHEIVAPEISTPRDANRFINAFSITWPAVEGDVDFGDFMALEAYRLFRPGIYQAVRANQDLVEGAAALGMGRAAMDGAQLDARLLSSVEDPDRFRHGLMRLFPKLESVWANVWHQRDGAWARMRRACAPQHFQTYFRLSLPAGTISRREINEFIAHAGEPAWSAQRLVAAASNVRRDGHTEARDLLDAWTLHAAEVPLDKVEPLLSGVFSVVDDLDIEGDEARGFAIGNNSLRVHWLVRALLFERSELAERSAILSVAAKSAQLGWMADLMWSAWGDHHPREGAEAHGPESWLLTKADTEKLVATTLATIIRASVGSELIEHGSLPRLLYTWKDFGGDDGAAVQAWTAEQLEDDHAVACIARAFTSHSWGQGMGGFGGLGDLVAKRSDRANVDSISTLMDSARLRARVEELDADPTGSSDDADAISRFLQAWRARDRFGD
ncbi:NTPase [Sphingomonas sp. AAP5]|uniref:KAP family P-loop NTPase fold protein n=1 Tax=Sphingomonas sp. AAP5 TaxID=1523415 RepID=UPI0010570C4E|nr:KAP family NTPase [Sphingomonas sp. AAP5]QBM75896.1 NTPase [Sphingomonas sp. AAP5]